MMEFNDNKPIYKQIVDFAFGRILSGAWKPGEMIPSVRELCGYLCVNNRTVLKAFDDLQDLGIIEPKRGMGYQLVVDAPQRVRTARRKDFINSTLPNLIDEMKALDISPEELIKIVSEAFAKAK